LVIKCLLIIQDYAPFRKGQAQGIYEHSGKIRALLPEYGRRKQPRRVGGAALFGQNEAPLRARRRGAQRWAAAAL